MNPFIFCCLLVVVVVGSACKPEAKSSNFPDEVAGIFEKDCATSGCHTTASAEAAAGLDLETWEGLMKGGRGGSAVIPYSPDQSFLLYSINTDSTLGPRLFPTMPLFRPALSRADVDALRQWMLDGARNAKGEEPFPPKANRKKWYVGHLGCDYVAVIDAQSKQVMRYVSVGSNPDHGEALFTLAVSPDRQAWYTVLSRFNASIEKYSTLTDEKVATIALSHNSWYTMAFSPDGKLGFLASNPFRDVVAINLERNIMIGVPLNVGRNVQGIAVHPQRRTLYLAESNGNSLVLVDYDTAGVLGNIRFVDATQTIPPGIPGDVWPQNIAFLPDGSKYFVACWHSNEVRVFDGNTDALLDVIAVGDAPGMMALANASGYLLVTCMEDTTSYVPTMGQRGAVHVINTQTHQRIQRIYTGFQPYGIAVDDASGYAVVTNRNTSPNGPAQHHPAICAGRNGNVTLIDLNTWQLLEGYKNELSIDPITVDATH
jgi:DNA-binding beta-propeller fold protein YncE